MKHIILSLLVLSLAFFGAGCSINTLVANALIGDGTSTVFTGDPDPELVGDALPFAIKMYESLLDATPGHQGLMYTTGSLFVMYANAYIQGPAEMLPSGAWQEKDAAMMRAKQMYLRGSNLVYDALEARYKGFIKATAQEAELEQILGRLTKQDVGLLYWAVAGGLAAYSIDVLDFELSARIPEWKAMILRAYELDPDYGVATLDEFLILFFASMPELLGGDKERARMHFERAQEKTGGNSVAAYVSYAQAIAVPAQDYETFRDFLEKALAIDPDANVSTRLATILGQRKARWLLDNAPDYFSFLPFSGDY
jgi:predicted anti-sigma-YlaC factor YlaD